jgi:hypothetical protein
VNNRPFISLPEGQPAPGAPRKPVLALLFGNVALWQTIMFAMLICILWVNEIMDLPNLYFGEYRTDVDWFGSSIMTIGIILLGFVTVANTFAQQRRILEGIIIVCSYCNKVKIEETDWEHIERYLAGRTLAKFSHGICPHCYDTMQLTYPQELADPQTRDSEVPAEPERSPTLASAQSE